MKRIITIAALLTFATGCVGRINKMMATWEQQHYFDLITNWGPPQQVFDDSQGGRILVWTMVRSWTTPGYATTTTNAHAYGAVIWGTSQTTYNPSQTYGWTAYRMFWVNKEGIIYRWAWRGL